MEKVECPNCKRTNTIVSKPNLKMYPKEKRALIKPNPKQRYCLDCGQNFNACETCGDQFTDVCNRCQVLVE